MRLGLALGGGGVRGLAHVAVLEALDTAGVRPVAIAGTSMGAIVGALYANGRSGRDIRRLIRARAMPLDASWRRLVRRRAALAVWLRAIRPDVRRGGLLRADRVLGLLAEEIRAETFEELAIPLRVVAADFWAAEAVVFESGPLLPALQASMAVPGVLSPVEHAGRVLVDGGVVNLVPYDLLFDRCDRILAVHVGGGRRPPHGRRSPAMLEAVLGAFDISHGAILAEKMRVRSPDLLVTFGLRDIPMFDFTRIPEVLRRAAVTADVVRTALETWMRDALPPS